jgi:hypothetical protein
MRIASILGFFLAMGLVLVEASELNDLIVVKASDSIAAFNAHLTI